MGGPPMTPAPVAEKHGRAARATKMRYLAVILFLLVLAAPFAMRRAVLRENPTQQAISSSGLRLVVITPHNPDIRNEFGRAFNAWHQAHYGSPGVIDFRIPGGSNDVKRVLEASYRSYREPSGKIRSDMVADIDVAFGGGDYFFDAELKPLGILQPIRIDPKLLRAAFPTPTLAGVKLYDSTVDADGTPTPQWIGVCLSSFGIVYNPDVYHGLGLPIPSAHNGWHDLTDSRLAGLVALADPSHSGSAAVAYLMVVQRCMADAETELFAHQPAIKALAKAEMAKNPEYRKAIAGGWKRGMSELLKIAANARYFTDSSPVVPMDVSRGEAAAGVAIDFYARVTQESVGADRVGFVAPIGATAITPDPVAILFGVKGAKLELAKHFIEFSISPDAQRLWILKPGTPGGPADRSLRRPPARRDVYADRTGWADDVNPFEEAAGFNQRGEWMSLFGDTRPIWVAAWIDSRDALKDAYTKILAVKDDARRAALIDELADLPIEMTDVEKIRDERKRMEQMPGELDAWRARQQIFWAKEFRQHYDAVGRKAT
jgi:iron(III) transport system substrate-binding protein